MTQENEFDFAARLATSVAAEGLRPLARRTGIAVGVLRAALARRDISSGNLQMLAEKLNLEFYVGPHRKPDDDVVVVDGSRYIELLEAENELMRLKLSL